MQYYLVVIIYNQRWGLGVFVNACFVLNWVNISSLTYLTLICIPIVFQLNYRPIYLIGYHRRECSLVIWCSCNELKYGLAIKAQFVHHYIKFNFTKQLIFECLSLTEKKLL